MWWTITLLAFAEPTLTQPQQLFGQPVKEVKALSAEEVEARRAAFDTMLQERGWVQIGDQVRPMGPDGDFAQPIAPQKAWEFPPHRATVFLNFFGAAMTNGTNAALDQSTCVSGNIDWPGFNGTEQQALALIQVFETQMAPYGVRIAYEERPPAHLPYAMVMMGGSPQMLGLGGGVLGVSCSSDCGDRWWRDATFAFTDSINPNNASVLGTTALHEAAHAFGLAHIGDATKIMNPFVGSADVIWADQCTPYDDATGGINCRPTHAEFCDGQDAQNSHAELLAYFGENSPDTEPPRVEILEPADGLELDVGASVTVRAEVEDNHEGVGWKFVIVEAGQESVAYDFRKEWTLGDLPQGSYTLRVEAIDHDLNESSDEVTIYVGQSAPATTGGDGSDGDGDGDDGSGDGSDGGTGSASGSEGSDSGMSAGLTDDESGCACRSVPGARPWSAAALLLLGLGAIRRRRALR